MVKSLMDGLAQTVQLQTLSLTLCAAAPWDLGADGKAVTCSVCPGLESPHFTDGKIVLQICKEPALGWHIWNLPI